MHRTGVFWLFADISDDEFIGFCGKGAAILVPEQLVRVVVVRLEKAGDTCLRPHSS